MKRSLVSRGNWMFWTLFIFLLLLMLPYFKNGFYSDQYVIDWMNKWKTPEIDTTQVKIRKDSIQRPTLVIEWDWLDFSGAQNHIEFNILQEDYEKAVSYREGLELDDYFSQSQLYFDLMEVSNSPIDSMVKALSRGIKEKNLSGLNALNYVVNAVQFPTYTKVTGGEDCPCFDMGRNWTNRCEPLEDGTGCCNSITPFAVFSPAEFIVQKTGDCDTKALVAYALLSRMGYKVAVLTGDKPAHAMLGVTSINPVMHTEVVNSKGRIYYPWEVTTFDESCVLGNMSMWYREGWIGWKVVNSN
jgi:hypothetical protein